MSNSSIRKLVLSLILMVGSLFSLSSYAWPEVDHMNMCGSAVATVRVYNGGFKGWQSRDSYVSRKSTSGAYYRANCPRTSALVATPLKPHQVRRAKRVNRGRYVTKCHYIKKCTKVRINRRAKRKYPYVAKPPKARRVKRTVRYDKHADCIRVDRMNRLSWHGKRG